MPDANAPPPIFFDLDGTLTDPKLGITRCIQFALAELGEAVPDADALEWCIGPPLQHSMAALVGAERAAEAVRLYRVRFADVGWVENEPYVGITEALSQIAESGRPLHVATSKPHVYATRIIEHFGLSPFFERVFGAELDGTRSDKAELLAHALVEAGVDDAARAMMVGDREHDVRGAFATGLRAIGVLWGYGTEAELRAAGANVLVSHPCELPSAVRI